jgi:hypothetical protein
MLKTEDAPAITGTPAIAGTPTIERTPGAEGMSKTVGPKQRQRGNHSIGTSATARREATTGIPGTTEGRQQQQTRQDSQEHHGQQKQKGRSLQQQKGRTLQQQKGRTLQQQKGSALQQQKCPFHTKNCCSSLYNDCVVTFLFFSFRLMLNEKFKAKMKGNEVRSETEGKQKIRSDEVKQNILCASTKQSEKISLVFSI